MHKLDHNRTVRSRLVGIIASTFAAMLLVASPNVAHAKNTPKVAKAPPGAKKHGRPPGVAAAGKARAKKPTWKERNAAKKAYKAGVAAMKKKDFVAAVEHFKSSFKQVESPNSKFMLARALTAEGKYVAAYTAISETVTLAEEAVKKNAAKYKKTLDAAKAEQAKLRSKVAIVRILPDSADPASKVFVAGQPLPRERWGKEVVMMPGPIEVLLRTANGDTKKVVSAAAGADMTVPVAPKSAVARKAQSADAKPASSGFVYRGPDRKKMAYIAAGVGGLGIALFGVLGVLSNSQLNRLEKSCEANACPEDLESVRDRGAALQVGANVSLGIGLVALAAGGGLYTWDLLDNKKDKADTAQRKLQLAVGPGTIVLSGSF